MSSGFRVPQHLAGNECSRSTSEVILPSGLWPLVLAAKRDGVAAVKGLEELLEGYIRLKEERDDLASCLSRLRQYGQHQNSAAPVRAVRPTQMSGNGIEADRLRPFTREWFESRQHAA
jgi:hypothetical protein